MPTPPASLSTPPSYTAAAMTTAQTNLFNRLTQDMKAATARMDKAIGDYGPYRLAQIDYVEARDQRTALVEQADPEGYAAHTQNGYLAAVHSLPISKRHAH